MLFFHLQTLGSARARRLTALSWGHGKRQAWVGRQHPCTHPGQQAHHRCRQNTTCILCQVCGFSNAAYLCFSLRQRNNWLFNDSDHRFQCVLGIFHTSKEFPNPAGWPTIQLYWDTIYLETASDNSDGGLGPTKLLPSSPPPPPTSEANCKTRLSLVLLNNWL